MKKLLAVIFALLPVLAFAASPNHTAKSTQTKSVKTAVKKVEAKKWIIFYKSFYQVLDARLMRSRYKRK